jgi:Protein of unknown function (DUF1194)
MSRSAMMASPGRQIRSAVAGTSLRALLQTLSVVLALGLLPAGAQERESTRPESLPPEITRPEILWHESGPEVDVALVLAVDISYSMDQEEQALQREGYIAALGSPELIEAIRKGLIGRIAVTYIEWAGMQTRHIVADWHIIEDAASAKTFIDILRAAPIRRGRRTSITGAIEAALDQLRAARLRPIRRVVDISGDGPNNEGVPVTLARDHALRAGVVINGLPIILKRPYLSAYDLDTLDDYYADCVIGGPGSFMNVITERDQFRGAIRAKILREVAQATGSDAPAGPGQPGRSDCLIGERQWRQNWERN